MALKKRKRIDLLTQRQLDDIASGNGAYLETFLRVSKASGFTNRLIFAPQHSFGNRPWTIIHPRIEALIDEVEWPQTVTIGPYYWSLSAIVWSRFFLRSIKELGIRLGVKTHIESYLGRPALEKEQSIIAEICNADPSDITIAEYSSMGPVLSLIKAQTRKGVLMHDVLSNRVSRFQEQDMTPDFKEITVEEELDWCRDASLMIYASANELEEFSRLMPSTTSSIWLRPEPPTYGETPQQDRPARLVFIGTTHAGNSDALGHFLDDVWPIIRASSPDTEFHIVGSIGKSISNEHRNLSGVKVLGRVDKLEEIGGPNAIGIAPTRLATGVSIKVAEYLFLDMPCVAYPLALQGFGNTLDEAVSIAETHEEFAKVVLDFMQDREMRYTASAKGKSIALEVLSNSHVERFLNDSVKQVVAI